MAINSQRKGAGGEREFVAVLTEHFPTCRFLRNTYEQRLSGGTDIVGLPGFSIEVKRYRSGEWYKIGWWQQVCNEADKTRTIPELAFRYDRRPWHVVVPAQWVARETITNAINEALVMDVPMFVRLVSRYATVL